MSYFSWGQITAQYLMHSHTNLCKTLQELSGRGRLKDISYTFYFESDYIPLMPVKIFVVKLFLCNIMITVNFFFHSFLPSQPLPLSSFILSSLVYLLIHLFICSFILSFFPHPYFSSISHMWQTTFSISKALKNT